MKNDVIFKIVTKERKKLLTQIVGIIMIAFGIFIISTNVFNSENSSTADVGGKVSFGFFLIMLGMPFFFPDMLKGGENFSSMRLVVFMIISVFVIITIKLGWSVTELSKFQIDGSWKYIIGLALGGKAAQSFAENLGKQRIKPSPDSNILDSFDARENPISKTPPKKKTNSDQK